LKKAKYDYILDMSYNTPFLNSVNIENSVHAMQIFNADKVIPVVQETHRYFKHNGNGLRSIVKTSNLKLERDLIYKHIYGFNLFKKNIFFKKENKLKISHVVLNNQESFELRSEEDLKLFNFFK